MTRQLYLDMDGVLADFDKRAAEVFGMPPREFEDRFGEPEFWRRLYETPDFFATFDPMPDAFDLWEATKHITPIVLTGIPRGEWAVEQKRRWIAQTLGPHVEVITCASRHKAKYCRPGDVLIDDRPQYAHLWEAAGGVFIVHTDAASSLAALHALDFPARPVGGR